MTSEYQNRVLLLVIHIYVNNISTVVSMALEVCRFY